MRHSTPILSVKVFLLPIILVLSFLANSFTLADSVHAASLADFQAGRIIDDAVFTNQNTMTASQIQTFITVKGANCVDGEAPCLKNFSEGGRTAAQIIYDTAQQYTVNPQSLIVTLQKETGLVTVSQPGAWRYRTAMGYGCPDSTPGVCDSSYYGFTNQMKWAATMYHAIMTDNPNWYTPYNLGNNNILWNPNNACGTSVVNIENRATKALYNYTPYRPNQAALDAGYGLGDGCSSYGNRNFYLYFNDWFGSSYNEITYVQMQGTSGQYIIYNGKKQALTYDGLLAWGINKLPLITMTSTDLDKIPSVPTALTRFALVDGTSSLVFADNSTYYDINDGNVAVWGNFQNVGMSNAGWALLRFAGFGGPLPFIVTKSNDPNQYLMEGGTLLPISSPTVVRAWGGSSSIAISDTYAQNIPIGNALSHNLASVNGKLYLISGSQAFSVPTNVAALFSSWQPYIITPSSLGRYTQVGTLSHLVKSDQSGVIFAIDNAKKRPINSFDVFLALRNSSAYESRLSNDAIDLLPTDVPITSAMLLQSGTSNYYLANGAVSDVPSRLVQEYNLPATATTVSGNFINLFAHSSRPVSQFAKTNSQSLVYFVSEGKKIPINRYDVMVLLDGQDSITTLPDSDLNALTTSATPMTPVLSTSGNGQNVVADQKSVFTYASGTQLSNDWNLPQSTPVSAATYNSYASNLAAYPLANHIQAENGEFCFVDQTRYCAEQFNMIYVWDLLNGVVHPSNYLLSYLNIPRSGALSSFVSAKEGQSYSSNVFSMMDGSLRYITTPAALANLGFTGSITRISAANIDSVKSGITSGYLYKTPDGKVWVVDGGKKREVTSDYTSNWTSASIVPENVSSYLMGMYPQSSNLTKSVTSSSTGTIYGMDSGLKRGITTYSKYLQSWTTYTTISPPLLELLPEGSTY